MGGDGLNLFGWNWLAKIKLDWKIISSVRSLSSLEDVLRSHELLFKEGLGTIKNITACVYVDRNVATKFYCPRTVSLA